MELLNTLISRHSVRTYNGEPLLSSDLEKILKAAKAVPVDLGLYDQMHLTVVNNRDFIAKLLMLRTFAANLFLPYQSFFSFVLSWFFLRSSTIFANHSTLAGS